MATNVSFGQFVDPEQQAIERQRALAQALRTDSLEPIQQREAGGRAVKISPWEGVAKLAKALAANYAADKSGEAQLALNDQRRTESTTEMQGILKALRGQPGTPGTEATPEVQGNNPSAYVPAQAAQPSTPATAANPDEALRLALSSRSPMAQQLGGTLMSSMLPKPAEWKSFEKPNADGTIQKGVINMTAPNPISTFQAAGTAPVKNEFVNGQGVNPYTSATSGQAIPKQPDAPNLASDLLVPGQGGGLVPNTALINAKRDIAKAGASSNNISVSTEKGYGGKFAELLATNDVATLTAAQGAPAQIATSQRIRKLLDTTKPITGTGADVRLGLNKAFATAGLVDPKTANATEALVSDLAKQTLQGVKSSGLGSGQGFTDKDLKFLESATSGSIGMTPENIRRMAELNERAARETIKKGQSIMKVVNQNPEKFGMVGKTVDLQMPSEYTQPGARNSVLDQADAILRGGQ